MLNVRCRPSSRRFVIVAPVLYDPEALRALSTRDWLLVHVAQPDAYARGHLAGARLVTPRELVRGTPPAPGRLPEVEQLEALFSRLGYRPNLHIVTYDDEGGGWAGRFGWTLDVIGHANWGYIDGGVPALQAAGIPLAPGPDDAGMPTDVTLTIHREPIAEISDVLAAIGSSTHVVLDVRSREEYEGTRVTTARSGHIPGAVNIDWLKLQDAARQTRLVRNLDQLLRAHGVTSDRHLITHCQTHHRSGLSYLAARLLGFPHVKAYHGSWSEWGNREDTPIER